MPSVYQARKVSHPFPPTMAGAIVSLLVCAIGVESLHAQTTITLTDRIQVKGVLKSVGKGVLTVTDESGKEIRCKIQDKDQQGVSLGGAQALIRFPAKVTLEGDLTLQALKPGVLVSFEANMNRVGRTNGEVESLLVFDEKAHPLGVKVKEAAKNSGGYARCVVAAEVYSLSERTNRLVVTLAPNAFTRKPRVSFQLGEAASVRLESDDYHRGRPGDEVTSLLAFRASTGDVLVKEIAIKLAKREPTDSTPSKANPRNSGIGKYRNLSDAPKPPRDIGSAHFLLHTDISDRSARVLLDKLETMAALVSQYYGAPPKGIIECYVVRKLENWQGRLPSGAAAKIAEPAGVTRSLSVGRKTKSIVYCCDDHGVVQHEAIHAYCAQTFGDTGPTWYAEGMAEMGQYWKKGQLAVDVDPVVIDYLKKTEPKKLLDIVAAGQITGDSWRAYSWRWALCHLLANNPNYSGRFKALGIAMMSGGNANFESVYGPVAREISFEYDLFVKQLDNGYRADLCAWQWNRKFLRMKSKGNSKVNVLAKRGWQATSVLLEKGVSYDSAAKGTWKTAPSQETDANGAESGQGKLIAIVKSNYELGEPFELGAKHTFVAPQDGQLFVRCRDGFHQLADNDGSITLYLRRTP